MAPASFTCAGDVKVHTARRLDGGPRNVAVRCDTKGDYWSLDLNFGHFKLFKNKRFGL